MPRLAAATVFVIGAVISKVFANAHPDGLVHAGAVLSIMLCGSLAVCTVLFSANRALRR